MTESREHLVPASVRANDYFLRDLRQLFNAPTELLKIIANQTEVYPYSTLSDSEVEELANRFGETPENIQRTTTVFLYLKGRLIETGREPTDVMSESRDILRQEDLAKGREDEIASVFSYLREDREEALAVEALSGGPAFVSAWFRPCLSPVSPSSTELVGSYFWTISYIDAEGERRSVTVGLTPGKLEQLQTTIDRAKEQLRTIRDSVSPAQKAEG